MKVLAIRGENLASLPKLEVLLEEGPLAETGLFAITGPTGAGKSTLLDALCLALYDRTPRLEGQREVPVGGVQVHAADPRTVLRRGAGQGRAEVDFEGKNGRFRAVWAVRRARQRPDGKLQPQEMALYRLPDLKELSGATKTETLRRIESEVGLSFDEFRRAVLLAQGDFAAFLEARPDQRAELLEKMTGTSLYGALSRAAFQRAKDQGAQLERLLERRAAIPRLLESARVALEAERSRLQSAQGDNKRVLERLRAALARAEALAQVAEELQAAEEAQAQAQAAVVAAEPERQLLEQGRRIGRLRPQHATLLAEQRRATDAAQALQQAETQLSAGLAARDQSVGIAAALERGASALRLEAETWAPKLTKARALEVEHREAERQRLEVEAEHQSLVAAQREQEAAGEAQRQRREALQEEQAELGRWLAENEASRVLAAQWSRWSAELERLVEARAEAAAVRAELSRAESESGVTQGDEQGVRRELEAADQAVLVARARTLEAQNQLEATRQLLSPSDVQTSLERLAREHSGLAGLGVALKEVAKLDKQLSEESKRQRSEASKQREARTRLEAAKGRRRSAEDKLKELAKELSELEATESLSARREELLREGQPCPLCGALEHPGAGQSSERNPRLAPLKGQRTRLEAAIETAQSEQQEAELAVTQHGEASKAAAQKKAAAEAALLERQELWRRGHEQLQLLWSELRVPNQRDLVRLRVLLPEGPDPKHGPGGLAAAEQLLLEIQAELRGHGAQDEALREAVEARRREEDRSEVARERIAERLEKVRDRSQAALHQVGQLRIRSEAIGARAQDAESALEAAFARWPDWQKSLAEDPVAFRRSASAAVETWEDRALKERSGAEALRALAASAALSQAELDRTRAREQAVAVELLGKRSRASALAEARAQLLDGRSADAFEAQLKEAIGSAELAAAEAKAESERWARTVAAAEERALSCREASQLAIRHQEGAETAWRAALLELGLEDGPALGELLERRPEDLEALALRLQALQEQRARAETTLLDRRARQAQLLEQPVEDAAVLRAALAEAERAHAETLVGLGRLQAELAQDEAHGREVGALDPLIAAQAQTAEAWLEISQVIGSADGKKFRTFAQSLTLEALIEAANRHLLQLRPRYRLERIPGIDMELLVVDRDLGDEARAVASLSGGETFLVSLALALGLASLSAKDVRLGSLFIDEGFGSLDRDALELALGTLDQLQAEGRTVGLISHIPDLAERIGYVVEVRPIAPGTSQVETRRA